MGNPLQMVSVDTPVLEDELPPGAGKRTKILTPFPFLNIPRLS